MWTVEHSKELYGIERWGNGYFDINKNGNLIVKPTENDYRFADVKAIIDSLKKKKISFPVLLRFPQILEDRVKELHECFTHSIIEFKYKNRYLGVFPMKVNQRREVIEEILKVGKKYDFGLEAGSKAELIIAITLNLNSSSLIICNGFKDEDFLRIAFNYSSLGKKIIIIIDEISEVYSIVKLAKEFKVKPLIGIRAKLYTKGSGKWKESGGENAKFGLTTVEMIHCIEILQKNKLIDCLKMLHFHIGSQIPEIKRIKDAVKESARVYAKVRKMGVEIEYLNVGGGLAVDYDGSKTSFEASANYTIQEYTNNVIYSVKEVCDSENVPHPTIVTESGRAITVYHSLLVMNIKGKIPSFTKEKIDYEGDEPYIIKELYDCWKGINIKNYSEYYHDAIKLKEDLITLFNLGQIELEDRAKGEILFREVCKKAVKFAKEVEDTSEEFEDLYKLLSQKYIGNFSVFQSIPDTWGIKQLFPVMPVHKLNENPEHHGIIVDITCDSDGEIDRFVDLKDIKEILELHPMKDCEEYYVAIFLLGAYQDVIGDYHNLLGTVNECHIIIKDENKWQIRNFVKGDSIGSVMSYVRYDKKELLKKFNSIVKKAKVKNKRKILKEFENELNGYTYLEF